MGESKIRTACEYWWAPMDVYQPEFVKEMESDGYTTIYTGVQDCTCTACYEFEQHYSEEHAISQLD
jgi:hypothetical protein